MNTIYAEYNMYHNSIDIYTIFIVSGTIVFKLHNIIRRIQSIQDVYKRQLPHFLINSDWDFTCSKKFNNCYILLSYSSQTIENTTFVTGELSLTYSLVLYRPTSVYGLW